MWKCIQHFHFQADGSPLSLDQQLCWRKKPKIFHPVSHVSTVLIVRYIHPNSEIFVITTDIPSSSMSVTWEYCPGMQSPWWRGVGTRSVQIVQRWSYLKISQSKWRQKSPIDQLEWRRKARSLLKLVIQQIDAHRTSDWNSQEFSIRSYSSWSR